MLYPFDFIGLLSYSFTRSVLEEGKNYSSEKLPKNSLGYLENHPIEFDAWVQRVKMIVYRLFSTDSAQYIIVKDGLQAYEDLRDYRTPNAYDNTTKKLLKGLEISIDSIDNDKYEEIVFRKEKHPFSKNNRTTNKIFIGHGRSSTWRELKDFLQDRLKLDWDEFNREPTAGISVTERLNQMLDEANFAFIIMTAEDEHSDKSLHARENVIHEAGLFQGRLGFKKAIILLEEGCNEFSNINGLIQIRFPKGKLSAKFEEIRGVLERENIINY